jgi:hypothetical protein
MEERFSVMSGASKSVFKSMSKTKDRFMNSRRISICVVSSVFVVCLAGCARLQTHQMKAELREVAKRWCLTIRASQVIPVYPLTEDIQPGDVFLVQTPIPKQISEYTKRGFLPLDLHLHRLAGLSYSDFYSDAYFKGDYGKPIPHDRPKPKNPSANAKAPRFSLAPLPAAAFPDYTFEAKRGMGTRLAVPINGVPVGLSFLGASTVNGSVKMSDAFTYGLDDEYLLKSVYEWAGEPDVQLTLARTRSATRSRLFLRVVSRVYLVGRVTVSLQAQGASSGGADVGAAKSANPFTMTKEGAEDLKSVAESYKEAVQAVASALNEGLPGGSVRFVAANRGSVVLDEQFGRLLALGYLGFDLEVDRNGRLGPPVATLDILEQRPGAQDRLAAGLSEESRRVVEQQVRQIFDRIVVSSTNQGGVFTQIKAQMDAFGERIRIPDNLAAYEGLQSGVQRSGNIKDRVGKRTGFERYMKYRTELNNTREALDIPGLTQEQQADREAILKADAELIDRFETSPEVALALRLYYERVLMRAQ